MIAILVAAATVAVYTGLMSPARTEWMFGLGILAAVLLLALAAAMLIRHRRPRLTAALLHAWTPLLLICVATVISAGLIIAFDMNAHRLPGDADDPSGAAGIVGGLAALAALIVEGSRDFVGAHRTPWLARKVVTGFVGDAVDERTTANADLWDRLHGAGRDDPGLWRLRGIRMTLEMLRQVLLRSERQRHAVRQVSHRSASGPEEPAPR